MASGLQRFESNRPLWEDDDDGGQEPDKRQPKEPEPRQSIPLTTFESSIQNVAAVSFLLGCTFMFSLLMLVGGGGKYWKAHVHLLVLTVFHMLEFLVTAVWNHTRVTITSFLLDNGREYWFAHLFSIFECLVTQHFFSANRLGLVEAIGLSTLLIGQVIRTLSMVTAAQSFNHKVSTHMIRRSDHVLVTEGVYSIFRHPSYFGFFWWTIGLQVFLRTHLSLFLCAFTLWKFFNARIQGEEIHLIKFFGKDYIDYKSRTGIYIPFIR